MENIIENNKLIAEFMNIEIDNRQNLKSYRLTNSVYSSILLASHTENLFFHDSWTWLMPVVEKIEQLKNRHGFTFSVKISGNYCTIESYNYSLILRIVECNNITKFKSVYHACIEFIKWYNSHLCSNCGRFDDVVGTHSITICEECALNNTVL